LLHVSFKSLSEEINTGSHDHTGRYDASAGIRTRIVALEGRNHSR
jgi:hypothetical protein